MTTNEAQMMQDLATIIETNCIEFSSLILVRRFIEPDIEEISIIESPEESDAGFYVKAGLVQSMTDIVEKAFDSAIAHIIEVKEKCIIHILI